MSAAPQFNPFIWLNNGEDEGRAGGLCLVRNYQDSGDPAVFVTQPAPVMLSAPLLVYLRACAAGREPDAATLSLEDARLAFVLIEILCAAKVATIERLRDDFAASVRANARRPARCCRGRRLTSALLGMWRTRLGS